MPKIKMTITGGKVHNVTYRLFLLEEADRLLIPNFDARNVKIDGKQAVVALAEGDDDQIKEFISSCKSNFPEDAEVEDISVEEYAGKIRSVDSFRNSFSISQLSKIGTVGVKMLEKQDEMLSKQDKTIAVIKDEGQKTRDTLKKHLFDDIQELRQEITEIKTTLSRIQDKIEV